MPASARGRRAHPQIAKRNSLDESRWSSVTVSERTRCILLSSSSIASLLCLQLDLRTSAVALAILGSCVVSFASLLKKSSSILSSVKAFVLHTMIALVGGVAVLWAFNAPIFSPSLLNLSPAVMVAALGLVPPMSNSQWSNALSLLNKLPDCNLLDTLPAICSLLGMWAGAFPLVLDQPTPDTTYPVPLLVGALYGFAFGSLAASAAFFWRGEPRTPPLIGVSS